MRAGAVMHLECLLVDSLVCLPHALTPRRRHGRRLPTSRVRYEVVCAASVGLRSDRTRRAGQVASSPMDSGHAVVSSSTKVTS